ncbi:2TM domain-containing protein [Streptomyces sp. ODS28]|uniref:2TM domain-containing protein n=1 Tax=Streptomyces sp. ODS28 TaxID=3136688 RepID=UPI0031E75E8C
MTVPPGHDYPSADTRRAVVRKRLERRRQLMGSVSGYLFVNAVLIVIWLATGSGYFWPGWVLAGWGVLLIIQALSVHGPVTEEDVDRALRKSG